jgi:carbonic anhydrase
MQKKALNLAVCRGLWLPLLLVPVLATGAASAQSSPLLWGGNQSPINITPPGATTVPTFTKTADLGNKTTYTLKNTTGMNWCKDNVACEGTIDNRWGSLKAYPPEKPTPTDYPPSITFGGVLYTLKEFHFHSPAEHLLNGHLAKMEIHFVFHKSGVSDCSASEYLVIGQLIVEGAAPNPELLKIFGPGVKLPGPGQSVPIAPFIIGNVLRNFPAGTSSYRYAGSLTAPAEIPSCGIPPSGPAIPNQLGTGYLPEVVSWVLLTTPLTMSADQIALFQKLFPNGDARSPQKIVRQRVMMGRDSPIPRN